MRFNLFKLYYFRFGYPMKVWGKFENIFLLDFSQNGIIELIIYLHYFIFPVL